MTDNDLLIRLQEALGDAYAIECELGGGGMSHVFLAEETRLGRKVVVKVLPPDMGAGVNAERFEREIQLAAKLQHPHIVPLLTAGSEGDLLYYMMPFIEGQSLRLRLARETELPVSEAVRILKEVADALAYAHRHGVVHRDIKPDNILLTEGHAVVMDFGVAKAVQQSSGSENITTLGVALGTPAYMAPEQAVADPNVDHRADIYALGATAYEMLCGHPPFTGSNPQAVLAMHVTEPAAPVTKHRPTVPEPLNVVIMRCLEKRAADRWQKVEELIPHFDSVLTPSGGMTPTGTRPVPAVDYEQRAKQAHPVRVAVQFAIASIAIVAVAYGIMNLLGLPDWVTLGAVGLLAAGLPIMVITGYHERNRAVVATTGLHVTAPVGLQRHFTWRKALTGGALAFSVLTIATTGFMASRLSGVGPAATLVSSGVLDERERLVLAEFDNAAPDSTIGETVTELFRIDLSQSPTLSVITAAQVSDLLMLMGHDREEAVTQQLAREIAQREGMKAYIVGEVRSVATGFVISAQIASAASADVLVSVRETADDEAGLIAAVDKLSAGLREKTGESLRSVRSDARLERLTTTSLEGLRLYAQADRVADDGDYRRAIALLEEAVARDTNFAMAYRRLGMYMTNPDFLGQMGVRGDSMLRRAYSLRDRLSDRERYTVEASYWSRVEQDHERAATSYVALLEKYPDDGTALNNLGVAYGVLGRYADQDDVYRRAIDQKVASAITYNNLVGSLIVQGELERADTVNQRFTERFPSSVDALQREAELADARAKWDSADEIVNRVLTEHPSAEDWARFALAELAERRGQLREAGRQSDLAIRARARQQDMSSQERDHQLALNVMLRELWFSQDRTTLSPSIGRLLETEERLSADLPPQARGFRLANFIWMYTLAGQPEEAGQILAQQVSLIPESIRESVGGRNYLRRTRADIAAAAGRNEEAIRARHEVRMDNLRCASCDLVDIAWYFDLADKPDSALVYYEQWLDTPGGTDSWWMPVAYRRSGEIHEAQGNAESAIDYYDRFVELWNEADPELEPIVSDIRSRIARLVGEGA